jgi:hypothetical protein
MKKHLILIICTLFFTNTSNSQDTYWGGSVGVSFAFGNKVNRVGIALSAYYNYKFVQINSSVNWYYNYSSLALNKPTPELQLGLGAQFGYVKMDSISNNFIGLTESNMPYKNSVGYAYVRYIDRIKTTQSTGIVSFKIDKVKIASENDIFAGGLGYRDRFRTGAFYIEYQYLDTKIGINTTFWTGDYTGSKTVTNSDYPSRFGYVSDNENIYGNFSSALLSMQIKQLFPYQQVAQANFGVDDEHIRNVIQNKLMHDLPFLPQKWMQTEQPHIPMLAEDGKQYLFKENQKVKPTELYFNVAMNSGLFY